VKQQGSIVKVFESSTGAGCLNTMKNLSLCSGVAERTGKKSIDISGLWIRLLLCY